MTYLGIDSVLAFNAFTEAAGPSPRSPYFVAIKLKDDIGKLHMCCRFYSFFGEKALYKFNK